MQKGSQPKKSLNIVRILSHLHLIWRALEPGRRGTKPYKYSAQVKEKSLRGNWNFLEELPEKFLESDTFGALETGGIRKTGTALYKISSAKFLLIFESTTTREKL